MFSGKDKPLLLFSCHHKVGTAWFSNILNHVATEFDLKFEYNQALLLSEDTDIFFDDHSRYDLDKLELYKGVHIIRDPRDVIVSGYHYHKWTEEDWANIPSDKFGGKSYKEKINSFQNEEQGIAFEMENVGTDTIIEMMMWNYSNPNVLEIKFEELLKNPDEVFDDIFRHYGFSGEELNKCLSIANSYTFDRLKKKFNSKHLRKGIAGDWRNHFTDELKTLFKDMFPGVLEKLGYEKNMQW